MSSHDRPNRHRKVATRGPGGPRSPDGSELDGREWLTHWLNNIAKMTATENGWDAYYYAVTKHLIPGIGAHKLTGPKRLVADHLEALYRKMMENRSKAGTAHQVHRTIRAALNDAKARDHITKNPAEVAKPPTPDE